jgi:hypothetical protein
MNLIDASIEAAEERLKKMYAKTDTTKLSSNRLLAELELNELYAIRETWRLGKPFSMGLGMNLARAMGFQPVAYPILISRFIASVPKYQQVVRNLGIPEHLCDFITLGSAAAVAGDLPPLSVILVEKAECTVATYGMRALAEHFKVPFFTTDDPLEYNEKNIKYVADQLAEFIEFAETKIPGIKYDRDKHLELLEAERIGYQFAHKDWELRKLNPLPMSIRDSFHQPLEYLPSAFGETGKVLDYIRLRTEEIQEQAAKKGNRQDKLRVLWIWIAPLYFDFLAPLESRGVAVPCAISGATGWQSGRKGAIGDENEFKRRLSPLEEEARMETGWSWRQLGREWEDEIIWSCRELKCEAIIYFQSTGCMLTSGSSAKLVADRAMKELGVPTLLLQGRPMYSEILTQKEYDNRVSDFLDAVLASKGID